MHSSNPVSANIKQGETQCIQICSVKPIPKAREDFLGQAVPEQVLSFYKVNDVCEFQFDRPFHRPQKDDSNEFKVGVAAFGCECMKVVLLLMEGGGGGLLHS